MSPRIALPFPTRPNDLRGSYSISFLRAKLVGRGTIHRRVNGGGVAGAAGPSVSASRCHLTSASHQGGRSAIDDLSAIVLLRNRRFQALLAVARGDEAPLRLERGHVRARQLLGNLDKRGAAGGEPFDEAFVDRLA